jgi:transposase
MDKEQQRAAKVRLVAQMQAGQSWQVAAATAGVQTSQSTAYRLLQVVRKQGETALLDGRHGHPSKLRGEARTFLEDYCRKTPQTPSSTVQAALRERFNLSVSVSQINRVRAALGVSNHPQNQEQGKKRK